MKKNENAFDVSAIAIAAVHVSAIAIAADILFMHISIVCTMLAGSRQLL
jgi:cytochrome b